MKTAEEWVAYTLRAAAEAAQAAREAPRTMGSAERILRELEPGVEFPDLDRIHEESREEDVREAAAVAFRACLPPLVNRRNAQAYIACVAAGVHHDYLSTAEAKTMLYTAQLALSAHPKRRSNRGRK